MHNKLADYSTRHDVIFTPPYKIINQCDSKVSKVKNIRKVITSNEHRAEKRNLESAQWQQALCAPRCPPGQGLLPPLPDLSPKMTVKGLIILAAAQLNVPSLLSVAFNNSPVLSWSHFKNSVDHAINRVVNKMTLWDSVDANVIHNQPWTNILDEFPVKVRSQGVGKNAISTHQARSTARDIANYLKIVDVLKHEFPELFPTASAFLKQLIEDKHGLILDPDKVMFVLFDPKSNSTWPSSTSFTGYEHVGPPLAIKTLTEQLLSNAVVQDGLNDITLRGRAGLYNQSTPGGEFGKNNEVCLLPEDFIKTVIESNFSKIYTQKLESFWNKYYYIYRIYIKGLFITLLGQQSNQLSDPALKMVMSLTLGHITNITHITMEHLEKSVPQVHFDVIPLSINGYKSSDVFIISEADGLRGHKMNNMVVLYRPTNENSFQEFDNHQELKEWIKVQGRDPYLRTRLASHFSLRDRQDNMINPGVDSSLIKLGAGSLSDEHINNNLDMHYGDLFTLMTAKVMDRTISDAELLITSNLEIFKQNLMRILPIAAMAAGVVALIFPPAGSLALIGIGALQIGLGIDEAFHGDAEKLRRAGAAETFSGGLNMVFGAFGLGTIRAAAGGLAGAGEVGGNAVRESVAEIQAPLIEADILEPQAEINPEPSYHVKTVNIGDPNPGNVLAGKVNSNIVPYSNVIHPPANYEFELVGLTAIEKNSILRADYIRYTMTDVGECLNLASNRLHTLEGREIAARYLGLEKAADISAEDMANLHKNIIDMRGVITRSSQNPNFFITAIHKVVDDIIIVAFYIPMIDSICLTQYFFNDDPFLRIRTLMHEIVHAGVKEGAECTPDYFYIKAMTSDGDWLMKYRDEMLYVSQAKLESSYFSDDGFYLLKDNFKQKMGGNNWDEAVNNFRVNQDLRKALLLKNPDTQTMMVMELSGTIPEAKGLDGKMKLPWENGGRPMFSRRRR
ncbi:MAG: DUF6543 domain-containing protein [Rouxiella badensis]|uniref:dermonecrotic toxin domain-containing protein n=1 Tax=Rouxiella badensis TaxID=1646377 RepID=UPI003C4E8F12